MEENILGKLGCRPGTEDKWTYPRPGRMGVRGQQWTLTVNPWRPTSGQSGRSKTSDQGLLVSCTDNGASVAQVYPTAACLRPLKMTPCPAPQLLSRLCLPPPPSDAESADSKPQTHPPRPTSAPVGEAKTKHKD